MFSLLILSLVFLFITVLMDNSLLGLLASLMLGLFAFMNVPGLQLYVVELAEKYVPKISLWPQLLILQPLILGLPSAQ